MSDDLRRATLLRAALGAGGPVAPTEDDWHCWSSTATTERVVPLLYGVVANSGEGLTPERQALIEEMQLDVAALCVRIEASLLEVAGHFDAEEIPFAVLKGCATAHLDYEDPSQRQFGDVDLLVAPEDFDRSRRALEVCGWRQAYALPRRHLAFTHAATFTSAGVTEVDLHQRIGHRALGLLVPPTELLDARLPYEIAGREVWALTDVDRMIHAAVHATASRGGYRRLSSVADVLVLSRKLAASAAQVLDRAQRWRVRTLVEAAVRDAHLQAMLPLPSGWATAMARPTEGRDRLVDRAYLSEGRRPATEEIAYLRLMTSWTRRIQYLHGHIRADAGPGSGSLRRRLRYLRHRLRQRT